MAFLAITAIGGGIAILAGVSGLPLEMLEQVFYSILSLLLILLAAILWATGNKTMAVGPRRGAR